MTVERTPCGGGYIHGPVELVREYNIGIRGLDYSG